MTKILNWNTSPPFQIYTNKFPGRARIVSTSEDYDIILCKPSFGLRESILLWLAQLQIEKGGLTLTPLVTILLEATIGNEKCQVPRSIKFQALGTQQE